MPLSPASWNASRSRPSRSAPSATYRALIGTPSRSASTTGLRPMIHSASEVVRRFGRDWVDAAFFSARFADL